MQILIELILILLVIIVAEPVLLFTIEVIFAFRQQPTVLPVFEATPKVAILMPAHNEEAVIGHSISSLQQQMKPDYRLIVIADNCSDKTVEIVRAAGAEVIARNDAEHKGKGFALEFGIRHLEKDPPDIVIMIDADCSFEEGAIHSLVQNVTETNRPVQALYLFNPDENSSIGQYISALAVIIKNHVRALGLRNMGVPCQLTGSGMAFPWAIIKSLKLGSDNIVEDMKMGIDLVKERHYPLFCPKARVNSKLPSSKSNQAVQRTRWEHGHLQTIVSDGLDLLLASLKKRRWKEVVFALDLIVPPLSMVVFFIVAGLALTAIAFSFGAGILPFVLMVGITILFILALFLAWWRFGKNMIPAKILIGVPGYVLSKASIYLAFIRNREKEWIRTERD